MSGLTKYEQYVIDIIRSQFGSEWFVPANLPHTVNRPLYVCRRLRTKDALEHKFDPKNDALVFRLVI